MCKQYGIRFFACRHNELPKHDIKFCSRAVAKGHACRERKKYAVKVKIDCPNCQEKNMHRKGASLAPASTSGTSNARNASNNSSTSSTSSINVAGQHRSGGRGGASPVYGSIRSSYSATNSVSGSVCSRSDCMCHNSGGGPRPVSAFPGGVIYEEDEEKLSSPYAVDPEDEIPEDAVFDADGTAYVPADSWRSTVCRNTQETQESEVQAGLDAAQRLYSQLPTRGDVQHTAERPLRESTLTVSEVMRPYYNQEPISPRVVHAGPPRASVATVSTLSSRHSGYNIDGNHRSSHRSTSRSGSHSSRTFNHSHHSYHSDPSDHLGHSHLEPPFDTCAV